MSASFFGKAALSCPLLLIFLLFPAGSDGADRLRLTLEDSLKIALEKNLQIRIATLSREAVKPEIRRAESIFHPSLGVSFTAAGDNPASDLNAVSRSETQLATGFLSQQLPTGGILLLSTDVARDRDKTDTPPTIASSDLTVSIVQPLLRGGRVYVATRPIRDAESDVRIEEARLRGAVLRVVAATRRAYYNVNLAENVIEVIKTAIKRDEALIEASEALLKAGLVTTRDVISAQVSLTKDSERLVTAEAELESARYALFDVLGLPIGTEAELLDREVRFEPVPLELEQWIDTAVKERPEVLELEQGLAKSSLNIRVARNSVLPQVDLTGSYSKGQTSTTVARAFGLRGDAWSAGLVFSIPLGNVAARAGLARAEIEHMRLEEQLLQQKRVVELEVRGAEIKLRRSLSRIAALGKILEHAKNLNEVAKERFARGMATNLDITNAQEDILNAETDLLEAMVDYNTGLAELEAALARPLSAR